MSDDLFIQILLDAGHEVRITTATTVPYWVNGYPMTSLQMRHAARICKGWA